MKGRDDTERGGQPADLVRQRHLDGGRLVAGALHRGHTRKPLNHGIVCGRIGVMALGAEAANRAVDNFRIEPANFGVSDSEPVRDARPVVLDHRVAFDRELTYDVAAVILLEVDHEAALVAVEGEKGRGHAVLEGSAEAAGGIALRRLDFDHVGAQIAKQHRAKRSRHDLTKVQDTKACQWSFCHRFQPRACGHVPPLIVYRPAYRQAPYPMTSVQSWTPIRQV